MKNIFKASFPITFLFDQRTISAEQVAKLEVGDILSEMDTGDFIGQVGLMSIEPVARDQVERELLALANDGTFFDNEDIDDDDDVAATPAESAERVPATTAAALPLDGWNANPIPTLVIVVRNGCVRALHGNGQVDVVLLDFDTEGVPSDEAFQLPPGPTECEQRCTLSDNPGLQKSPGYVRHVIAAFEQQLAARQSHSEAEVDHG